MLLKGLTVKGKQDIAKYIETAKNNVIIDLSLTFGYVIPKSYTKKLKVALIGQPKTTVPDVDNLVKNVLDRGNGLLWQDDKSIYKITSKKIWDTTDYIDIKIQYTKRLS